MQLRAERKKNIRLGIIERLDVTMARVAAMHAQMRQAPAEQQGAEELIAAQVRGAWPKPWPSWWGLA